MNSRIIKSILSNKFKHWCETITDLKVRALVKENSIITGGSIVSLLLKEEVKDFDVYFTNKETTLEVAKYYVNQYLKETGDRHSIEVIEEEDGRVNIKIKSTGVVGEVPEDSEPTDDIYDALSEDKEEPEKETETKKKYRVVFVSSNAITLSDKIQIVVRFYGDADKIHENYDFVHCTSYWTSKDSNLVLRPDALECILTKQLKYIGSKYPLCSVIRTRKFLKREWNINAGQYLKMLFQVSRLDLTDINVLADQLVGVDSSYFNSIIENLKKEKENNPNFVVDNLYLATLIDKIF